MTPAAQVLQDVICLHPLDDRRPVRDNWMLEPWRVRRPEALSGEPWLGATEGHVLFMLKGDDPDIKDLPVDQRMPLMCNLSAKTVRAELVDEAALRAWAGPGKVPPHQVTCPECKGKPPEKCTTCAGKGRTDCPTCGEGEIECRDCGGDGKGWCDHCDGDPLVEHEDPRPGLLCGLGVDRGLVGLVFEAVERLGLSSSEKLYVGIREHSVLLQGGPWQAVVMEFQWGEEARLTAFPAESASLTLCPPPAAPEAGPACPPCGHVHQGARLAYICIGCPCEERPGARPPPAVPEAAR